MIAALEKISKAGGVKTGGGSGKGFSLGNIGGIGALAAIGALGAAALKGVGGIALLGAAIPAFFGALSAGDKALGWLDGSYNYENIKKAAIGFSDMILSLPKDTFVVLGGIMGLGAIGGTRGAAGIAALGAAIPAFFGALGLGEHGLKWLNADFNFPKLKAAMTGFSDAILSLKPEAMAALGGIISAGGIAAILSRNPASFAIGIGAIGAGIAAFFVGLGAGDAALTWLGADFSGIAKATKGFSDAVGNLDAKSGATLLALFGAGAILGKITTAKQKASFIMGMGAMGVGITAFLAPFALVDGITALGANFTGIQKAVKGFADSISYLDQDSMTALGALMAAGGIVGMVTNPVQKAKFVLGMGAIGAGISAFFAGFAGIGDLAGAIGVDGSGAVPIIKNFALGLKELEGLDGENLMKVVPALALLGPAMVGLLGAQGLGAIGDQVAKVFDAIFGTENDDTIFEKMVKNLKPLEEIDATKLEGFNKLTDSLARFAMIDLAGAGRGYRRFSSAIKDGTTKINRLDMNDYEMAADRINMMSNSLEDMRNAFGQQQPIVNNNYFTGGQGNNQSPAVLQSDDSPHSRDNLWRMLEK